MQISKKRLDDLINGIEQLLLENRDSFSEDERTLLSECKQVLQEVKEEDQELNQNCQSQKFGQAIVLLIRILTSKDDWWDLF